MTVIQNSDALSTSDIRRDALALAEAGYAAIDVGAALRRALRVEGDSLVVFGRARTIAHRRIHFVGIGKCALVAARAAEHVFGDLLTSGIALDVANPLDIKLTHIKIFIGTHPLPSEENIRATNAILHLLEGLGKDDLVVFLISGGGSTLLCSPDTPMTCIDESTIFSALSAAGAPIQELNTVRKHTSHARGGWFAQAAFPAEAISLIVSDVPGNEIASIASGPTVRDDTTADDAREILERYGVIIPPNTAFTETPKDEKYFERVENTLLVTNQDALNAMRAEAETLGYHASIVSDRLAGNVRDVAGEIAAALHNAAPKTALLYAGETTVVIDPDTPPGAAGGRNQELALAVLPLLIDNELILPFASDGHDNTEHAGAIADTLTREHASAHKLTTEDVLVTHRSYDFFTTTGDAIITGYTGSNVSDLIIAIKQ